MKILRIAALVAAGLMLPQAASRGRSRVCRDGRGPCPRQRRAGSAGASRHHAREPLSARPDRSRRHHRPDADQARDRPRGSATPATPPACAIPTPTSPTPSNTSPAPIAPPMATTPEPCVISRAAITTLQSGSARKWCSRPATTPGSSRTAIRSRCSGWRRIRSWPSASAMRGRRRFPTTSQRHSGAMRSIEPESRASPVRNCAPGVRSGGPRRNVSPVASALTTPSRWHTLEPFRGVLRGGAEIPLNGSEGPGPR